MLVSVAFTRRQVERLTPGAGGVVPFEEYAPAARLEGRIALSALFDRFPTLTLAAPLESLTREPALLFNKLTALPVRA